MADAPIVGLVAGVARKGPQVTAAVAYRKVLRDPVITDPDWLPAYFGQSGNLVLHRLSADNRRDVPFLRPDFFGNEVEQSIVDAWAARVALEAVPVIPLHFIFHTAFCGTTLISNAIDALRSCAAFKEPAIFTHLAHRQGLGEDLVRNGDLDLTLRFFARQAGEIEAAVVKPACFANPLIPAIMGLRPESQAVFVFSDLRPFLLSVAKRGLSGSNWARQAFTAALAHHAMPLNFSSSDMLGFTDLQAAGLAWLMRTKFLQKMRSTIGPERCRLIDGSQIIEHPMYALSGVLEFLSIDVRPADLSAVAESEILIRHSKSGHDYDREQRDSEARAVRERHGEEVDAIAAWIEKIAALDPNYRPIVSDQLKSSSSNQ